MAERGLFSGVFGRGDVDTGDQAWLAAMLDTEAALARALERAGLAPAGAGGPVTQVANAGTLEEAGLAMHVRAALRNGLTRTRSPKCSFTSASTRAYRPSTGPLPWPSRYWRKPDEWTRPATGPGIPSIQCPYPARLC
jgi:hypothetical protein